MIKTMHIVLQLSLLALVLSVAPARATSLSIASGIPEGLVNYLLPRFTLKTQIRFDRLPRDGDLQFRKDSGEFGVAIFQLNDGSIGYLHAARWLQDDADYLHFRDWLLSEAGRATISDYREQGVAIAIPVDLAPVEEVAIVITGNADVGRTLSLAHCSRCHKVDRAAKYSGMDSSPSFHAMRGFDDWYVRFLSFYAVSPHKALITVEGSGIEKDPDLITIAPIELRIEQVNDIVAFVHTLEPLDLGRPIQFNP